MHPRFERMKDGAFRRNTIVLFDNRPFLHSSIVEFYVGDVIVDKMMPGHPLLEEIMTCDGISVAESIAKGINSAVIFFD